MQIQRIALCHVKIFEPVSELINNQVNLEALKCNDENVSCYVI